MLLSIFIIEILIIGLLILKYGIKYKQKQII